LSVRAQRERHQQLQREREVLRMRESVVSAIAPAHLPRVGSSAIFEAVDEALAQIVAAGDHLREPDEVKALWITYARRRVIDGQRSAEFKHRADEQIDGAAQAQPDGSDELLRLTEDARQWWRIREILSVLHGDQRRWAEAWYDHVLSASRESGAQPRGLPDVLGWTPSKTKSVSRRARLKMAAFIDDRARGAVCDEKRTLLDAFVMAGRAGSGGELDDERYQAVLFHVAGCENCWADWHCRRRALLGRCGAILAVPADAVAMSAQALEAKLIGLAHGLHGAAYSMMTRLGIGGAAAAGGGAATLAGKATAVCVGVVCAATAGGELVGVLPPIARQPTRVSPVKAAEIKKDASASSATRQAPATHVTRPIPIPTPVAQTSTATAKSTLREVAKKRAIPKTFVPRSTLDPEPASATESGSNPTPAGSASPTFSAVESPPPPPPPPPPPSSSTQPICTPGSLGC
jgi:DNA-directed RNA polymerase specialized sigma24 family protein